jgi:hypothetical protein
MAKNVRVIAVLAALNLGFRKNSIRSMGCSKRRSHQMNATDRTAAMANNPRISPSVQPRSGASMIPYTRVTRAAIDRPAPTGSSGVALGSLDSGTSG